MNSEHICQTVQLTGLGLHSAYALDSVYNGTNQFYNTLFYKNVPKSICKVQVYMFMFSMEKIRHLYTFLELICTLTVEGKHAA